MAERAHPWRDWAIAGEAAAWLAMAGLALRTLPFARLAQLAAWPRRGGPRGNADDGAAQAIGRAVEAAARRAPWPVLCFEKGLAAHAMLRLRGQPSVLYYGGRMDQKRGLTAHVWVELSGLGVVGGREAAGFAVLARFPSADAAAMQRT
jgi:Transglutaminase-like superfamily